MNKLLILALVLGGSFLAVLGFLSLGDGKQYKATGVAEITTDEYFEVRALNPQVLDLVEFDPAGDRVVVLYTHVGGKTSKAFQILDAKMEYNSVATTANVAVGVIFLGLTASLIAVAALLWFWGKTGQE